MAGDACRTARLTGRDGGVLLVLGSVSFVCWLFLFSYAYDVGLFKRHPDKRQREVRNRAYSTSYRLTGVLVFALFVFMLSGTNRAFDVGLVTPENVALLIAVLLEFLLTLPIALAAWLEPPAEEARLSLS